MFSAADAREYLSKHGVEEKLAQAIRQVAKERPVDPVAAIGKFLVGASAAPDTLSCVTWNIAAVNNNPFEYWMTHPDVDYGKLMEDVQNFIEAPGELDCAVSAVFTPQMFDELNALMDAQGWDAGEAASAAFADMSSRSIISGFLKDAELGSKRLMSMPDRMTNTIDLADGGTVYRPTVISCYDGDMSSTAAWWQQWKDFHFANPLLLPGKKGAPASSKLPCALLDKISRSKYPALSEEEEAMSVRLQTICLAIFDAILVHMLNTLSPGGKWIELKRSIIKATLHQKEAKTAAVLVDTYGDADVIFLQEVRTKMAVAKALEATHYCFKPTPSSKADQNSIILLSRARFDESAVEDVTKAAIAHLPGEGGAKIADGDLLVIKATDRRGGHFLLASFHGDTDGLMTAPTLAAVHAYAASLGPAWPLVFGLDANTYFKPVKPGKQAAVVDFLKDVYAKGLAASCGESADLPTSFSARTFLQPQLQKACKTNEKKTKGDYNPKDYILYTPGAMSVTATGLDNSGKRSYDAELVLPTLDWPSDHSLMHAQFTLSPG